MAYEGIGRGFERSSLMERAFKKADQMLKEQAIKPQAFIETYTVEGVRRDLEYVRATRETQRLRDVEEGREEENRYARIAEAIIGDGIGLYNWLGEAAHFIVPAAFDDIVNKIDGLVEIEETKGRASHIGLALDATFRGDVAVKLQDIEEAIRTAQPFRMKYFHSEILDIHGTLDNIPRAVFALDRETIESLAELWLANDKQALATHPVQYQLMEQLIAQCKAFGELATNADRPKLANRYKHAHDLLVNIREERLEEVPDTNERDTAAERFRSSLENLRSSLWDAQEKN